MAADAQNSPKPLVYVSYAWGDETDAGKEQELIVDELCEALEKYDGIIVGRDKRRQQIGDSIKDFAADIARADIIIAVVNKKYLRSYECMVVELHDTFRRSNYTREEFSKRVFLLLLEDAKHDITVSQELIAHWCGCSQELDSKLQQIDPSKTKSLHEWTTLANIKDMKSRMIDMLSALTDSVMPLGYDQITLNDFQVLRGLIRTRLKEWRQWRDEPSGFMPEMLDNLLDETKPQGMRSNNPAFECSETGTTRNWQYSTTAQPERNQLFISYSHEDREWVDRLKKMISPLVRSEAMRLWEDSQIPAGAKWKVEIEKALASAKVALLLVSDDFLASEFVINKELPPLLRAAEAEGLCILWVCLGPCHYEATPIHEYQAVLPPGEPLEGMVLVQQKAALKTIAGAIRDKLCSEVAQMHEPLGVQIGTSTSTPSMQTGHPQESPLPVLGFANDLAKQFDNWMVNYHHPNRSDRMHLLEWLVADRGADLIGDDYALFEKLAAALSMMGYDTKLAPPKQAFLSKIREHEEKYLK
jgi:hypothetical protein